MESKKKTSIVTFLWVLPQSALGSYYLLFLGIFIGDHEGLLIIISIYQIIIIAINTYMMLYLFIHNEFKNNFDLKKFYMIEFGLFVTLSVLIIIYYGKQYVDDNLTLNDIRHHFILKDAPIFLYFIFYSLLMRKKIQKITKRENYDGPIS